MKTEVNIDPSNLMFPPELLKEAAAPAWKDCPVGTIAFAHGGGWWTKQINGRWKANRGDEFPTPGGDACLVKLPETATVE